MNSLSRMNSVVVEVTKPASDNREYRAFVLENQLKVMVISDKEADKSAAALSVAAGSMNDPPELPGLAHFCEHMLFFETESVKRGKPYSQFIAENGGSSNAFTTRDQTNYHFDVSPLALKATLKRFSNFFTQNPQFLEIAMENEVKIVNSEHEKNLSNETWRKFAIEAATAKSTHSFSQFTTGNTETLWTIPHKNNIEMQKALKDIHHGFYSANIMSLVVLGKESLDDLQDIVTELFSNVENRNVDMPRWSESPYGPNELQLRVDSVPKLEVRDLYVVFPVPDYRHFYKTTPESYLINLIGHKGPGSLFSLLKSKDWASNLYINSNVPARGFGLFSIAAEMTITGGEHVNNIITLIFQYLELLRQTEPQKWFWEEMRDIMAIQFRFKDKVSPLDAVKRNSNMMHVYPLKEVLSIGYELTEYNPSIIMDVMRQLIPENCRITTISKRNEEKANITEKWYGVKYSCEKIEQELIEKWKKCGLHEELFLPSKNEFVPSSFEMKQHEKSDSLIPKLICDTDLSRVWFLEDNEFHVPKAVIRMEMFSPLPLQNPLNENLNYMMAVAIQDILTEYAYAASLAGLYYNIYNTINGLEIIISGYDHKLGILLEQIIERITIFSCEERRFQVLKETYIRSLINWNRSQPHSQATYYFTLLLREKRFTNNELLNTMNEVTLKELEAYAKEFVINLKLEWLVCGNFTPTETMNMVMKCQDFFVQRGIKPLLPCQILRLREVKLPTGSHFLFHVENKTKQKNNCIAVLFQTGICNTRQNILLDILEQIAYEPFFTQLRTKEQLGYIVRTSVRRINGTQGLQFLIQTDKDRVYVEERIDEFLKTLGILLKNLSKEQFCQHKNALAVYKAEKPKALLDRSKKIWHEIFSREYDFERQINELKELETITLIDVNQFFNEFILGLKIKRLTVYIVSTSSTNSTPGNKHNNLNNINIVPIGIEDVTDWKIQMELYPLMPFKFQNKL